MSNSIERTRLAARLTARRAVGAIQQDLHVPLNRSDSIEQPRMVVRVLFAVAISPRLECRSVALIPLLRLRMDAIGPRLKRLAIPSGLLLRLRMDAIGPRLKRLAVPSGLLLSLRTVALVPLLSLCTVALSLLLTCLALFLHTCPERLAVILSALDFPPPRPEHGKNHQTEDQEAERSTQGLP